jgi:hypothetical protein
MLRLMDNQIFLRDRLIDQLDLMVVLEMFNKVRSLVTEQLIKENPGDQ